MNSIVTTATGADLLDPFPEANLIPTCKIPDIHNMAQQSARLATTHRNVKRLKISTRDISKLPTIFAGLVGLL